MSELGVYANAIWMADDLPLVCFEDDWAAVMRCSVRQVQRLKRAQKLPPPLPIPGRPRWSRDAVLGWIGAPVRHPKRNA